MKEKYEPTPEEVKKAEERMTPSEKELSEKREEFVNSQKVHGRESGERLGDNPFIFHDRKDHVVMDGEVGGHRFHLERKFDEVIRERKYGWKNVLDSEPRYEGTVDGMRLPEEAVQKLFSKYVHGSYGEGRFREETAKLEAQARTEVEKERETYNQEKMKTEKILKELEEKGLI